MIFMKGTELPINTLIIIVIAVAVLIAMIALFYYVYDPSRQGISLEAAKSNACQMLASLNCNVGADSISISNFDADKDGQRDPGSNVGTSIADCSNGNPSMNDNLMTLCACYYGFTEDSDCETNVCGC